MHLIVDYEADASESVAADDGATSTETSTPRKKHHHNPVPSVDVPAAAAAVEATSDATTIAKSPRLKTPRASESTKASTAPLTTTPAAALEAAFAPVAPVLVPSKVTSSAAGIGRVRKSRREYSY